MTDETTNPTTSPTTPPESKPKAESSTSSSSTFAAYDTDYLRFVGGTHSTKKDATAAAKAAGVKSFEIREV